MSMKTPNQDNENIEPHDPQDALVDRLLAEALGGEVPPQQTDAILARVEEAQVELPGKEPQEKSGSGRSYLLALAVLLMLSLTAAVLSLPSVNSAPEAARRAPHVPEQLAQEPPSIVLQADEGLVYQDLSRSKLEVHDHLPRVQEKLSKSHQQGVALGRQSIRFDSELDATLPAVDKKESQSINAPQSSQLATAAPKADDSDFNPNLYSFYSLHDQPNSVELQFGSERELRQSGLATHNFSGGQATPTDRARKRFEDKRGYRFSGVVTSRSLPARGEYVVPLEQSIYSKTDTLGIGPGVGGDQYTRIHENRFFEPQGIRALSTFSIDVDTASYANVRQFLMQSNMLPPPDAVRLEEMINYFSYQYEAPEEEATEPFAANMEVFGCPWTPTNKIVRVGLKGREIQREVRPESNLVFLVDVSGSMSSSNKLPLVVSGLRELTKQLGENDRVAIVVYASSEGLACESTSGMDKDKILATLDNLSAGGSTAGGAGIQLAYKIAEQNRLAEGVNRVILCTDGDFNVGTTSTAELERLVEKKAKESGVFLSVLGFGRGNLNDSMMESISNCGNGNYAYIDSKREANKVLVEEMSGTLVTIAKDVKIQIEFNPQRVAAYRLLGYENRVLNAEDFNDDKKDAGEIGAGHTVTALYEITPVGQLANTGNVDELKYQQDTNSVERSSGILPGEVTDNELLTLKVRYKQPDGDTSTKLEFTLEDSDQGFGAASIDAQFASAVASFGMLLRNSEHKGSANFATVLELAEASLGEDPQGYRKEFLELVRKANELATDDQ